MASAPLRSFPIFSADPAEPTSYNFGPTDQLIRNIRALGAQVFFRVGRSNIGGFANNTVPSDFAKYGEIVRHVVLHYNKGWANGFHYGIRYWEIWNEPDFLPFWAGTPEQFRQLYGVVARAIRDADPQARVGGPAGTTHNDYTGLEKTLLQFIVDSQLPLDFYSFHHCANKSNSPLDVSRLAHRYRELLDTFGLERTGVICSEWNTALDDTPLLGGEAGHAAFVAETLMYAQTAPLDQSYYYWFPSPAPTLGKEHHAFAMVSSIGTTPLRLPATGGDNQGFAVLAGRGTQRPELRVLIAN